MLEINLELNEGTIMFDRDEKCPECGATAVEACLNETKDDCAREKVECPTCGATTTEPCLEEA